MQNRGSTKESENLVNVKDEIKIDITGKILLGMVIAVFIFFIMKAINIYYSNITTNMITNDNLLKFLMSILAFIASIICVLYYNNSKKEEMILGVLIYISAAISVGVANLNNYMGITEWVVEPSTSIKITSSLFRLVILIIMILPYRKMKKKICENKIKVIVISLIGLIALNLLEYHGIIFSWMKTKRNTTIYLLVVIIVVTILMCILIKRCIKEKEFIYMPIIISIGATIVNYIYLVIFLIKPDTRLIDEVIVITVVGLLLVNASLLIEFNNTIKKSKRLEEKNKLFYRLIDENRYSNRIILNKNSEVIYFNKAIENFYKKKGINNSVSDEINKDFNENMKAYNNLEMWNMLDGEKIWNGVVKATKANKVLRCEAQKIFIDENEFIYSFNFIDMTEEYKAKIKSYEFSKKLDGIANSINELMVVINEDKEITYINEASYSILGYSREYFIGKDIRLFIDGIEETDVREMGMKKKVFEHYVITKENNRMKFETMATPIYGKDGDITEWVFVCRDAKTRNELEDLKTKYMEMEQYKNIKNEYFARLSHELRTPINIIYSSLQLLDSKLDKDENNEAFIKYYRKYDKAIELNCFRTLKITNNLIDITALEAEYMSLKLENKNIVSLVENITLEVIKFVKKKNINIIFDTDIEEIFVEYDEEKMQKIILNLLSNAVKFTEENGNVVVSIMADEDNVKISVKDDGVGVPKELRNIIFERFVQVNKGLNRLKEGSGIGLTLVKSLVELHKGTVQLIDSSDKGSEFVITLPIASKKSDIDSIIENKEIINHNISKNVMMELSDIYDI